MKIAIHQPHYFPWLGYLDKMAKADQFIIMDQVQLTDRSNMLRNHFLTTAGKTRYLTVSFQRQGYRDQEFRYLPINEQVDWQKEHRDFIVSTYKKLSGFSEVWSQIEPIFEKHYETAYQVSMDTIDIVRRVFDITTPLVLQSELEWRKDAKKKRSDSYTLRNIRRRYLSLWQWCEKVHGYHPV